MQNKIFIIIVNYLGWKDTIECLESIYNSHYTNFQVIVVDNASPNNSIRKIKNWAEGNIVIEVENDVIAKQLKPYHDKPIPYLLIEEKDISSDLNIETKKNELINPLVIIRASENKGYSGGNNLGLRYAMSQGNCSYIWILNNDTVVDRNFLTSHVMCIQENKDLVLLGAKIFNYDRPNIIQSYGGLLNTYTITTKHFGAGKSGGTVFDENFSPDYIPGVSIFMKREIIDKIGFMPEEYFMYCEDVDWSLKAKALGLKLKICPDAIIWHKEGASFKFDKKSNQKPELGDHLSVINRLIVARKYFPNRILFVYAGILVSVLLRLFRKQPKRSLKIIKHILNYD